jgi:hypothetical protein
VEAGSLPAEAAQRNEDGAGQSSKQTTMNMARPPFSEKNALTPAWPFALIRAQEKRRRPAPFMAGGFYRADSQKAQFGLFMRTARTSLGSERKAAAAGAELLSQTQCSARTLPMYLPSSILYLLSSTRAVPRWPILGLALVLLASGCSTMDVSRATAPPPVSSKAQTQEQSGLRLTVDPFMDKATAKLYFGVGGLPPELMVLHLKVENTSTNSAWVMRRKDMQMFAGNMPRGASSGLDKNGQFTAGATVAVVGVASGLVLPLIMLGNLIATDATVVEHNFIAREWLDTTIYPGGAREGFIYFKLDPKAPEKRYWLSVSSLDAQTQQTNTLALQLTYESP